MTYQPYLIANYATGLDTRLQPWLLPDDAQEQLFDGYVYRGTMSARDGYTYLATGIDGGLPYRESRIVHTLTAVVVAGVIDSVNTTYTLAGVTQIARGSFTVTGTVPAQSVTDDGLGNFTGDGTGTIDYRTGAVSITFNTAPTAGTVLAEYSYMPGNPVMMIANFINAVNVRELVVADTRYVNRYNTLTDVLVDISPASPFTGNKFQFFTWVNYESPASAPRLLFCNNKDVIQEYDGTSVIDYAYTSTVFSSLTCSFMVQLKDRLILLRTTEDGTVYPKRIRISGTGADGDTFDTSATGAGFIDIPDGTWINGASANRDDLIIYTEQATWILKYSGNDTAPFVLNRIDESRGSDATFAAITYLNRSSAASRRGLIMSDGYHVERQDASIPEFSYDEVDGTNFSLCFAGSVDADRDHYLIYPPQGSDISKRILTTNYDEDNYAIYRLPLSCMGTYISTFTLTWNDLLKYENWDQLAADFGNWNEFAYSSGNPFSVGGGHKGEIWKLSDTESEDNPVKIRNITVIDDTTIEVTTDWNNYNRNGLTDFYYDADGSADVIYLTGLTGMQEVNNHQFPITAVTDFNVFQLDISQLGILGSNLTAYVAGGDTQRVIPFSALFKKFNPFVNQDKKLRCGWIYMYVDATGTNLQRNVLIENITLLNPCVVTTVADHNFKTGDQINIFGVVGTTEVNNIQYFITVIDENNFSLDGIDATAFTPYISGGYAGVEESAKIIIDIITNDDGQKTQLSNLSQNPYQGNCTNIIFEKGNKKWYKVFINQVGRFIQFRLRNRQAGAKINIQATMLGFQPIGRLI